MKISIKNMLIIIATILILLATTLLVTGSLGTIGIIASMNKASCIILLVAGCLLMVGFIAMLITKFVLKVKFKKLTKEDVDQINASGDNLDTKLALYILLNPKTAAAQGFNYGSLKLV